MHWYAGSFNGWCSRPKGRPTSAAVPVVRQNSAGLNVIPVTCYTDSLYVIHFKCPPNFGEVQVLSVSQIVLARDRAGK